VLQIGSIQLGEKPLFLAPMEDVTDPSFRYICKYYGADVMYTEFISSDGLIRDARKSLEKLVIYDYERPIGIQLYGHLIDAMVESARIAESRNPDFIDINFGCPVKKIARRGAGAGMLCNIPLMVEMTAAIVKAVKLPVTVKTRLGWDEDSKNIVDIAERLQDVGIQALTIHGRTRAQLYKGNADWTLIGEVKRNPRMHIPVIGNGDIFSPGSAKEAFEKFGVDGVMIGRGVVGRPWLFRDIKHFLKTGEELLPLTVSEKVELARLHFNKSIEVKGDKVGVLEMRRHFSNYFKGLDNFKEIRLKLVTEISPEKILELLDEINTKWGK
jgi:tRNA-dihydrouridine synthase B